MQQIDRKVEPGRHAAKSAVPLDLSGGSVVLPKFLRKPARQLHRLLSGGFYLTSRSLALYGAGFVFAVVAAGLFATGKAGDAVASVASYHVLSVKHYDISGNKELPDVEIVHLLAPRNGETLFGYDVTEARETLKNNPWVAEATVTKVFPDKVAVNIEERKPFAVWQQGDLVQLIDRNGLALAEYDGRFPRLPFVVGEGAEENSAKFIDLLKRYPSIASKVQAHIRVGDRRWDLKLNNDVLVMLPENGIEGELQRLEKLVEQQGIFDRDLVSVDLRLPDRMVVKLDEDAAELRKEIIEERAKQLASFSKGREL